MLHGGDVLRGLQHTVHGFVAHFGAPELPTAKAHDHVHGVSFFQEAPCVFQFDIEVVVVGSRPELNLLHLHGVRLLPGLLLLLLLLVAVAPVVQELDHGRAGLGGDLHKVEAPLGSDVAGFVQADDANLVAVRADETNWADADLVVYAGVVDAALLLGGERKRRWRSASSASF
jgi:hypothetical protein